MTDWRRDVLTYWFGLKPEQWWKSDPEVDEEIRERFKQRWAQERRLPVESFLGDPLTALAAVILFDQFPRNMFRGDAQQFATDHLALAIAKGAVDRGFDDRLEVKERPFLYMPFQHSENLGDQKQSLQLFTALNDDYQLGERGPARDLAVLNAGAAIYAAGRAEGLEAGVRAAEVAVDGGGAAEALDRLVALTGKLSPS